MKLEYYTEENSSKKNKRRQRVFVIFALALIVLYTSFFSYVNWNPTYGGWISNLVAIGFIGFLFFSRPKGRQYNFKGPVLCLMLLPFISMLNTNVLYGQTFIDSFKALIDNFVWVFYFILHKYKIKESTVIKIFLITALFIVALQIIQQFTYPNAMFGVASQDQQIERKMLEAAEQRNGLWRFRIMGANAFAAIVLFAFMTFVRKKMNSRLLIVALLMLVCIYLTLTRQLMASCLLTVFLSFFLGKKNKGMVVSLIIGAILFAILYSYADVLFGGLAEQTKDDANEDNIRLASAAYFWSESISSPFVFLFGHGLPGQTGPFRLLQYKLNMVFGFYTSDVGFIGMTYQYGAIYVIACYVILYKVFFSYKKKVPLYVRLFVIYTTVTSIMMFPFFGRLEYLYWSMIFYICDLHINKAKEYNVNTLSAS